MTGEIISVGTELLLGDIVNTNAAHAARRLAELGVSSFYQTVVGDTPDRLRKALEAAFQRADLVILTGGLGPTGDDLTKEVVASFFDVPLEHNQEVADEIASYLHGAGVVNPAGVRKQALIPAGALVFHNANGTAPGLVLSQGGRTAIQLPGPPREMEPMFDRQVMPFLQSHSGSTIQSHTVRLFGIGEAQVEQRLPQDLLLGSNPTIAPYAKNGEVELRITARGQTEQQCEKAMQPVLGEVRRVLGTHVYGVDVPNLQTALVQALRSRHLTIATAESLTGGLLSERLTQVPGASAVFGLGICAYANAMKEAVLGVSSRTLSAYGAVSPPTAAEMAAGVRSLSHADIGVSTTGLAGPEGGTSETPVGTVFIGVASAAGMKIVPLMLDRRGEDTRSWIRHATALHAFYTVLKLITKGDLTDGR